MNNKIYVLISKWSSYDVYTEKPVGVFTTMVSAERAEIEFKFCIEEEKVKLQFPPVSLPEQWFSSFGFLLPPNDLSANQKKDVDRYEEWFERKEYINSFKGVEIQKLNLNKFYKP